MLIISVSLFMVIAGVLKIFYSVSDMLAVGFSAEKGQPFNGFFSRVPWIHLAVEILIALLLIAGGIFLYFAWKWYLLISLLALSALVYSSLRNMGWSPTDQNKLGLSVQSAFGFIGGAISIIILIVSYQ